VRLSSQLNHEPTHLTRGEHFVNFARVLAVAEKFFSSRKPCCPSWPASWPCISWTDESAGD